MASEAKLWIVVLTRFFTRTNAPSLRKRYETGNPSYFKDGYPGHLRGDVLHAFARA
jgi:hypothetical protein